MKSKASSKRDARTKDKMKVSDKMIVYVVGDCGPEHNSIVSIHRTYEGALKAWNGIRLRLLDEAKHFLKREGKEDSCADMWRRMVKNLQCKDPKTIDNYPQETPYINEWVVEE